LPRSLSAQPTLLTHEKGASNWTRLNAVRSTAQMERSVETALNCYGHRLRKGLASAEHSERIEATGGPKCRAS